jgi:hypothetical protein
VLAETSEVDAVVSDAAYNLIPVLQKELVSLAMASNWPPQIISSLQVVFDGSNLYVEYPDSLAPQVQTLEYGNLSALPNSVLRSFTYRVQPFIKAFYKDQLASNLFDLEDIYV